MSGAFVPALFDAPGREDTLYALSKCIVRIQANGTPFNALAAKIGYQTADPVESAAHGRSLMSLDAIARLAYHFPEEWQIVEALWKCAPVAPPSVAERLTRIEREFDAIRKEVGA